MNDQAGIVWVTGSAGSKLVTQEELYSRNLWWWIKRPVFGSLKNIWGPVYEHLPGFVKAMVIIHQNPTRWPLPQGIFPSPSRPTRPLKSRNDIGPFLMSVRRKEKGLPGNVHDNKTCSRVGRLLTHMTYPILIDLNVVSSPIHLLKTIY